MKSTGSNDKFRLDCASGSYHKKINNDGVKKTYTVCLSMQKLINKNIQFHANTKKK